MLSAGKAPDSSGRTTLGGTDGSNMDKSCSLDSQDWGGDNDSCEFPGGGRALVLANRDEVRAESGGHRSTNSVIIDQSKSCTVGREFSE